MTFTRQLEALKRRNRLRQRKLYNSNLIDLASNDYLQLAHHKANFMKASNQVLSYGCFAAKASAMVYGYHPLHKELEQYLCRLCSFESCILFSSGFAANVAILEALPTRSDFILMDQDFHASGQLALKNTKAAYKFFKHNDIEDAKKCLRDTHYSQVFIVVEGVYSMSGTVLDRTFLAWAKSINAYLILDEAHSVGVIGARLLGISDGFNYDKLIKMGTLGKALGSMGAYVLANEQVIRFLENRAKPLIYSTALSLFDTAFALHNLKTIQNELNHFKIGIKKQKDMVRRILNQEQESLITSISCCDNKAVLVLEEKLKQKGYLTAAIRPPTVVKPLLRIVLRVGIELSEVLQFCKAYKQKL